MCTVGPSRPMEAPHSRPSSNSSILPTAMRSDSRMPRLSCSVISSAAMDCGMPLPWLPGKKRTVSQAMNPSPSGASSHPAQGQRSRSSWCSPPTHSAPQASRVANRPTTTAPSQKISRIFQPSGDSSSPVVLRM